MFLLYFSVLWAATSYEDLATFLSDIMINEGLNDRLTLEPILQPLLIDKRPGIGTNSGTRPEVEQWQFMPLFLLFRIFSFRLGILPFLVSRFPFQGNHHGVAGNWQCTQDPTMDIQGECQLGKAVCCLSWGTCEMVVLQNGWSQSLAKACHVR